MNENLSQIIADLFVNPKGGEEQSSKIQRLRDEIKKVIESEDAIFGRFCRLLESFQDVIPEERQRYIAALKALSTTSKLSQQEIIKAVNGHLEELKILEKSIMHSLPGWRDELQAMEAKSKELRNEISKLRENIARLESEEQGILRGMVEKEKEVEVVDKAMKALFTDIGTEITSIKNKVEEFTSKPAAAPVKQQVQEFTAARPAVQPVPRENPPKSDMPSEQSAGGEPDVEITVPPQPLDPDWHKKCPMCGGRMNFHDNDKIWLCYSCAYEESGNDEAQGEGEEQSERTKASVASLSSLSSMEYEESTSPPNDQPSKKKTCPVCKKKMGWYEMDKTWRCPHCDYERRVW